VNDGDINVDLASELQIVSGFGGINVPGWIADLTPEQVETAFGRGPGQLGLSLLRVRISFDSSQWDRELPTAQRAYALGARVFATPWTPPAEMKSNDDTVSGELLRESYGAYADHLLAFRDSRAENGVPLTALSAAVREGDRAVLRGDVSRRGAPSEHARRGPLGPAAHTACVLETGAR
jgi:O-glycosyl hydrolase